VLSTYGLTESCSQVATHTLADASRLAVTDSGRPLAGFELRIVRADGTLAAAAEVGSVEVRGAAVFSGYLHAPSRPEGSPFITGDLGSLDEAGRLTVVGRADDLIITGGENVHPAEVENVLLRIAGVREVVVFGLPDDTWGQLVAAAFVLEPAVELADVLRASRSVLASFRRVRRACAVSQLPTNATGKVSRKQAAELLGAALLPVEQLLLA
jgi:O-succinylbenzoic acid--CoA ligase